MKREPSTVARALRAVSLVLTLVSIVAFSTIAYSAYADYQGVLGVMGGTGSSVTATQTADGTGVVVAMNITIPNKGLYDLTVGLSCLPANGSLRYTCTNASVTVPPGQEGTLVFSITFQNVTQSQLSNVQAWAKLRMALQPFAELDLALNLGSMFG